MQIIALSNETQTVNLDGDFFFLNIEVFQIKFFLKIKSLKKN